MIGNEICTDTEELIDWSIKKVEKVIKESKEELL